MPLPEHDPAAYGRAVAEDYDALHEHLDPADEVEAILGLAGGGAVLELGIGTGRLALPLHERGVEVLGVDGSQDMVDQLRAKPGGADLQVQVGDFADADLGRTVGVVVLAFGTVYALPDQEAQVRTFRAAARHLAVGGRFAVQAWIPDPGAFRDGRAVRPVTVTEGRVVLETAHLHPALQRMTTTKVYLDAAAGTRLVPANHRYAWPAELDLMARLAGMRLEHRWEDWRRRPFDDRSTAHVSVWQKVGDAPW